MASNEALLSWAEDAKTKGRYAYLLLDGAQNEGSNAWLERLGVEYWSLFDGHPQASMPEIAPLLIPLGDLQLEVREKVCQWALGLGNRAPSLSWLESTQSPKQTACHLRNFHTVSLSDDQTMLMRWYDTRILPVWMACLYPDQLQQFTETLTSMNFLDRFGNVTCLFSTEQPSPPSIGSVTEKPVIELDDRQFGILMNASELDTLLKHLRQVIKDETSRVPERELYEFVGKYQQIAADAGVDDLDRQTQYVLLALYTSGEGVKHPECLKIMANPPAGIDAFHAAMELLPDEAWALGQPLWQRYPDYSK